MEENSDAILESRYLANPETGFAALYDRYSDSLFRFIFRFAGNPTLAEEILHDVFLQLLSGKYRADEQSNLKAWLFTVAKNRALNVVARHTHEIDSPIEHIPDPMRFDHELIEIDLHAHLRRMENGLPPDLKQTWDLRRQGMDYQQIATELEIPVGTVKSRMSRLVETLRKDFQK